MRFFNGETLESIGYNSWLFILAGMVLAMTLFAGTREIIFRLFCDYDTIMIFYRIHELGNAAFIIEICSPCTFIIHAAIRFFGFGIFEKKEKLKAHLVIINIALIAIVYVMYLYVLFRMINLL